MRKALIPAAVIAVVGLTALAGPANATQGQLWGPKAAATAAPPPQGTDLVANSERLNSSLCSRARENKTYNIEQIAKSGTVNISGWVVNFRKQGWKASHPTNAKLSGDFYSNNWLTPSVVKDVPFAVDLVLEQARANPDRGSKLMKGGWSEAAVTKRLQSVSCLYGLSKDRRLIPVVEQLAAANMDDSRYYGPPMRKAHNHGVMADRALIDAARILGRPDWEAKAIQRLRTQLSGTFDSCGMMFEQSSTYQNFHSSLWGQIANRTKELPLSLEVMVAADKARGMVESIANPDGSYEIIGDGKRLTIPTLGQVKTQSRWCPVSGWAATTTVSGALVQHGVVRFGPGIRFHGHADRGAMTWWVGGQERVGKRVLVDRGLHGKNEDWRLSYARGPEAHSTLLWAGGSGLTMSGRTLTVGKKQVVELSAGNKAGSWSRTITTTPAESDVVFGDVLRGAATRTGASQMFTLAPGWVPTGGSGNYRTADGWRLTVTCSASSGRAAMANKHVEHYPDTGVIEPAITVYCTAPASRNPISMTATLRVERP